MNAIAVKWTNFFDWESFLLTLYKPKLKAIKVYQSFTSSVGIGDGIIQCKASNIPNCVEFNDAMNLRLTPEAQHAAMARYPVHLYTTQPGLKPIKEVGMYENFGPLIPVKYRAETCPYPVLSSWIAVKKLFPRGTKIEKDFDGTNYLGEVTDIQPEARTYTVYYNKDETEEELSHYYIGKLLHKDEMKKYKVGTKILKKFQGTWYHGKIESIDVTNRLFHIKYRDGDSEDMDVVDVKKYLDTTTKTKRKANELNIE